MSANIIHEIKFLTCFGPGIKPCIFYKGAQYSPINFSSHLQTPTLYTEAKLVGPDIIMKTTYNHLIVFKLDSVVKPVENLETTSENIGKFIPLDALEFSCFTKDFFLNLRIRYNESSYVNSLTDAFNLDHKQDSYNLARIADRKIILTGIDNKHYVFLKKDEPIVDPIVEPIVEPEVKKSPLQSLCQSQAVKIVTLLMIENAKRNKPSTADDTYGNNIAEITRVHKICDGQIFQNINRLVELDKDYNTSGMLGKLFTKRLESMVVGNAVWEFTSDNYRVSVINTMYNKYIEAISKYDYNAVLCNEFVAFYKKHAKVRASTATDLESFATLKSENRMHLLIDLVDYIK